MNSLHAGLCSILNFLLPIEQCYLPLLRTYRSVTTKMLKVQISIAFDSFRILSGTTMWRDISRADSNPADFW